MENALGIEKKSILDFEKIRADFPILKTKVNKQPLVYLDNGATSQKPQKVIDAISNYYLTQNSNVHRGVHYLSQLATDEYEKARKKVATYINAEKDFEVIFTKGTTDGINLVSASFGKKHLHTGDEILISTMEHHSNIVPWQMLCEEKGAVLKVVPIHQNGELNLEALENLLSPKTKLLAITHVSNTLGTINPVEKIIELAHKNGTYVLIDGAQSIQHISIDVQKLDCDFFTFSGHKLFGPTGIGILYGKENILNELPPYQGGGDMIKNVTFEKTTYNELPFKFEAGTPNIEGAIGLGAAIDYVNNVGLENILMQEEELLHYCTQALASIPKVKIIGTALHKSAVVSFVVEGCHPFDIGTLLDKMGVAVRTGHHCTQPLMEFYKIPGTIRASMAFYNNKADIDKLKSSLEKAIEMMG
jgi:cysteine desulfurase / selenocysteine lyase